MRLEILYASGRWHWRRVEGDTAPETEYVAARSESPGEARKDDMIHRALRENPDAGPDNILDLSTLVEFAREIDRQVNGIA